jgi:hypothetical protein
MSRFYGNVITRLVHRAVLLYDSTILGREPR